MAKIREIAEQTRIELGQLRIRATEKGIQFENPISFACDAPDSPLRKLVVGGGFDTQIVQKQGDGGRYDISVDVEGTERKIREAVCGKVRNRIMKDLGSRSHVREWLKKRSLATADEVVADTIVSLYNVLYGNNVTSEQKKACVKIMEVVIKRADKK